MTIRRRCGKPDPPADSIVGGTFSFARCSFTCCQPAHERSTKSPYFEPSGSYAARRMFSRCSTVEGNLRRQRGFPHFGYKFNEGNARLERRPLQPWSDFADGNPR